MDTLARAGKNIFFKAVAELLSRFIYLFFFIYMARKIGPDDFGLFSFAFSFAGILSILVDPGINLLLTRDVSLDTSRTQFYINNGFTIKVILSAVVFILLWLCIAVLGYDTRAIRLVLTMGVFLIFTCFFDFFTAITDAHERMDIGAGIKVVHKLAISVLGSIALFAGYEVTGLVVWMVGASILSFLFAYYQVDRRIAKISFEMDRDFYSKSVPAALPLALTMIFSTIYFKIDVVMLSLYKINSSEIGPYSASVRVIELLNVLPAIFIGGIFPILSSMRERSPEELHELFKKSFRALLIIAVPIVVTTTLFSEKIIALIYGAQYAGSSRALAILIWTTLFIFPNFLLLNFVVVANRQRLNALFTFAALCFNVILNLYLIPRFGFIGASYSTVATDMLLFICTAMFALRYFSDAAFLGSALKPLACGAVLAGMLLLCHTLALQVVLPLSVAVYLALVIATKTVTIDDVRTVKRAFVRG